MNRIITVVSALLLSLAVSSQSVSQLSAVRALAGDNAELVYTASSGDRPDFYVFNRTDGAGFRIYSSDESGNVLLAYSDDGTFEYDRLPEEARWFLKQLQNQIHTLGEQAGFRYKTNSAPERDAPVKVAGPLLAGVSWTQTAPFNDGCPIYPDSGIRCVTGCMAVAMSQVMYCHKWPVAGRGNHSYTWLKDTGYERKLTADFSHPYDWNSMLPAYVTGYTDIQAAAVSRLLYDCGVAVDMQYGVDASSSDVNSVTYALRTYFQYKSARLVRRAGLSEKEWDSIITDNLDRGLPLIYSGYDSDGGGHAFVCDGYDSNGYFHFNFGWGGLGNGYYLSSVAGSFCDNQSVVCDIQPDDTELSESELHFRQLGNGEVEVASLSDESYSGQLRIPSSVSIDGTDYTVSRIGSGAFAGTSLTAVVIPASITQIEGSAFQGCDNLEYVVLDSESPLACNVDIFDNEIYSHAKLRVPVGTVQQYSQSFPWTFFCNISDGSKIEKWSEWQYVKDGTSTIEFGWPELPDACMENCPVLSRTKGDNLQDVQFKIDNWLNTSLLVNVDMESGKCTVPRQPIGIYTDGMMICASDVPTFNRHYSYLDFPCTYNSETGVFSLFLIYFPSVSDGTKYFWYGTDWCTIDGFPTYDIRIEKLTISESGLLQCSVSFGEEVARYAYAFIPGRATSAYINNYAAMAARGSSQAPVEYSDRKEIEKQFDEPGTYTFVLFSLDSSGNFRKYCYVIVTVDENVTPVIPTEIATSDEEVIYDFNGRRMRELQKGLNIVNGVKIFR